MIQAVILPGCAPLFALDPGTGFLGTIAAIGRFLGIP